MTVSSTFFNLFDITADSSLYVRFNKDIGLNVFSSPEPKAQGEVLWSLTVRRRRRPSVRPSVHNL